MQSKIPHDRLGKFADDLKQQAFIERDPRTLDSCRLVFREHRGDPNRWDDASGRHLTPDHGGACDLKKPPSGSLSRGEFVGFDDLLSQ